MKRKKTLPNLMEWLECMYVDIIGDSQRLKSHHSEKHAEMLVIGGVFQKEQNIPRTHQRRGNQ